MRELNVVIIDDEPLILENLKYVLKRRVFKSYLWILRCRY